jgi:hypothetical protein
MTRNSQALRGLGAGVLGGLVAWLLIDKSGWFFPLLYGSEGVAPGTGGAHLQEIIGALYGAIVSGFITAFQWRRSMPAVERLARLILAAVGGAIAGAIGFQCGQLAYLRIDAATIPFFFASGTPGSEIVQGAVARAASWMVIGGVVGAAQGIGARDSRVSVRAALGGLTGGLCAGFVFEAIEIATSSPPAARFMGFILVAASLGFFASAETMRKRGWLRIDTDGMRGADSQLRLDKTWTTIGRSELADIRLFGSPEIAPIHCAIESGEASWKMHPLQPGKSPVAVDGSAIVADIALVGGEVIEIAGRRLLFTVKDAPASLPAIRKTPAPASSPDAEKVPEAAFAARSPSLRLSDSALAEPHPSYTQVAPQVGKRLVGVQGPYHGQAFKLPIRGIITVGRHASQDIALVNDFTISRRHATLRLEGDHHVVEDLGSANGTYLNGTLLARRRPAALKPGDHVRFGDSLMRYE